MKRFALAVMALGGLTLAAASQTADAKKELGKLQGTWNVVALEANGQKAPAELIKNAKLVFKGDTYTFHSGDQVIEGMVSLDLTKTPKQIDAKQLSGPGKGKTRKGIYQLEGDDLKLCLGQAGGDVRPKTFATAEGEPARLYVLKRAKP
jgi:uncharacterized protein (TIGR03067 family)